MKIKKPKIIDNPIAHLKSYSFLSLVGTVLLSVAYGLSLAFGMGLVSLSPTYIILAMGFVACLGAAGKFIKQSSDKEEDNVQ